MVDTLLANIDRAHNRAVLAELGLIAGGFGLVTLHRPATVDDPGILVPLMDGLGRLSGQVPLVFAAQPSEGI